MKGLAKRQGMSDNRPERSRAVAVARSTPGTTSGRLTPAEGHGYPPPAGVLSFFRIALPRVAAQMLRDWTAGVKDGNWLTTFALAAITGTLTAYEKAVRKGGAHGAVLGRSTRRSAPGKPGGGSSTR